MDFRELLINYMNLLDCTAKDICDESGLSPTLVSRYINNKRAPKANSNYVQKIADAFYNLSQKKALNFSRQELLNKLNSCLECNAIDCNLLADNLNILQENLNISTRELSKAIGYDPSFISRIKNKERRPSNIDNFVNAIADYIVSVCSDLNKKEIVSKLFSCTISDINNEESLKLKIIDWMTKPLETDENSVVSDFLRKLDTFKLEDYIYKDFSKIKVPTTPVLFRSSKTFFGIDGRKKAESEFMKTTLISNSTEPIFFYSNLPIAETASDEDFKNKWIIAVTMLLKRGFHLNMVHDIDRPLNEMLLGLESWLPVYMTGAISPYYFETPPSNLFKESIGVSGSIAMHGECIKSDEKNSMFYLTTKKDEVPYFKEKAKYMLSKCKPLMKIFNENNEKDFENFLLNENTDKIKNIKKDIFKNMDFLVNGEKWIVINKNTLPKIHFVIYNKKLINALEKFLLL